MNTKTQFAAALLGVLVLGAVVLMPTQSRSRAASSDRVALQAGSIVVASEVIPELPQDQVQDLTY